MHLVLIVLILAVLVDLPVSYALLALIGAGAIIALIH